MTAHNGKCPLTGRFMSGNKFWTVRSSHGPDYKFENPEDLWKACCEYFQWVEDNPLFEDKVCSYEGSHEHVPVAKMRAMTIHGLCFYLHIIEDTWRDWRKNRPDLSSVIKQAETVIRDQKFSGAAAGLLNANIIARDLGLSEKSAIQNLNKDGEPTDPPDLNLDAILAKALAIAKKEGAKLPDDNQ